MGLDGALFAATTRFRVLDPIGQGARGVVYRAYDRELGTEVALKTLGERAAGSLTEIKREFRSLLGISHRNLVQLYELFAAEGTAFFSMELVSGRDIVSEFRAHLRPATPLPPDAELRFADVTAQLVDAIACLHDHNRLHRDLKPSNILVTQADSRVVVLDFGLAQLLDPPSQFAQPQGDIAGTFAYMAPEILSGQPPSMSSDWYSMGAVLREVWTGERTTFTSSTLPEIAEPTDPAIAPMIDCIRALLADDPSRRPTLDEIRDALPRHRPPSTSGRTEKRFVGRYAERDELRKALGDAADRPLVVSVSGPSGIGKSSLVEHFARGAENDGTIVFHSRCHHQEALPYKAFDGLLDQVAEFLERMPAGDRDHYLPEHFEELSILFPALATLRGSDRDIDSDSEPFEIRRRAFVAARELLNRIGKEHSLVVWIDDLQWADPDSAALLREILRPPGTPRLLLVLSYRSEDALSLGDYVPTDYGLEIRSVRVGPLAADQTRDLLREITGSSAISVEATTRILEESGGFPLFLEQLARHSGTGREPVSASLEEIVLDRLSEVSTSARILLETLSVAGQTVEREFALTAAGFDASSRPLMNSLEANAFIRSTAIGAKAAVEVYHDKIREIVVANLPGARREEVHFKLATTAESGPTVDPSFVYRHYRGAKRLQVAGDWAVRAADQASEGLAFLEAARLFAEARELLPDSRACELSLAERQATALVNAGHCSTAAPIFAETAKTQPLPNALRLRRLATEQYLVSGHIEEGVWELRELCRDLRVPFPQSTTSAMLRMLGSIVRLRLRGLGFSERDPACCSPEELTTIDLCDSAGKGLVVVDPMRGLYFSFLSLLLALRAGESRRVARGLCMGGAALSPITPIAKWGRSMIERVAVLGEERGDPYFRGLAELALGQCLVVERDWENVLRACDHGAEVLARGSRGTTWERNVGRVAALRALEEMGRFKELDVRTREFLAEARSQGDRYAQVVARQNLANLRLANGDTDGAAAEMDSAMAMWGTAGFHMQHFYQLRFAAWRELAERRPRTAWEMIADTWPALERSNLLRHPTVAADARLTRARAAIALAHEDPGSKPRLAKTVASDLRAVARDGRGDLGSYQSLLEWAWSGTPPSKTVAQTAPDRLISDRWREIRQLQADGRHDAAADRLRQIQDMGLNHPARWLDVLSPGFPPLRTSG